MIQPNSLNRLCRVAWLLVLVLLAGCGASRSVLRDAGEVVARHQQSDTTCQRADRCAAALYFAAQRDAAHAAVQGSQPLHFAQSLERGEDALLLRLHLIRAARISIDLQSYLLGEDDTGYLLLHELLEAARRGVKVRVLVDQLFSVDNPRLLARLAIEHAGFELRMYNPIFNKARTSALEFAGGILCCLPQFHHRMHNKLLLIDREIGVTGGRNYADEYFDWNAAFNYLDRDILVMGPAVADMAASFEAFWNYPRSVSAAALDDVARILAPLADEPVPHPRPSAVSAGTQPSNRPPRNERADPAPIRERSVAVSGSVGDELIPLSPITLSNSARVSALLATLDDERAMAERFPGPPQQVDHIRFVSDPPGRRNRPDQGPYSGVTTSIRELVTSAESEILLQTPYLILSRSAREVFKDLRRDKPELSIRVAANSLAATDHFVVYAMTKKYRRRFVTNLGFDIYELKPRPQLATDWVRHWERLDEQAREAGSGEGTRVVGHAKTLVIDRHTVLIGSHNFDPRSEGINTESAVIVRDPAFAAGVAADLETFMAPANAWVIHRREDIPVLSRFSRIIARVSEALPLFDLWPFRYTTSYDLRPGFAPLQRDHPDFFTHYRWVGDYPGVPTPIRPIKTWFVGGFGDFALPIL